MLNTLLPITARPSALSQLSRDMDRFFEMTMGMNTPAANAWPGLNAWQDGESYFVEAEVPGFGIDDVQVEVSNNTITIRGQRERSTPAGASTIRSERSVTRFERAFRFPSAIEHEQIDASLSNGVLQVRAPLAESARPKRIEIRHAETNRLDSASRNALPSSHADGETEKAQSDTASRS